VPRGKGGENGRAEGRETPSHSSLALSGGETCAVPGEETAISASGGAKNWEEGGGVSPSWGSVEIPLT